MIEILQSPANAKPLKISADGQKAEEVGGTNAYPVSDGVISFLPKKDSFYEGTYLNRVHYLPFKENFFFKLPLWVINGGYIWNVRKHFSRDSILLELGCASGVDYFGKIYQMIGLDLSYKSLQGLQNYGIRLQADALNIPLRDNSIDGIISSYFWEHIDPKGKEKMLTEFRRVLKPGGKLIFLYDVETNNTLILDFKKKHPELYSKLFLEGDGHIGYETPQVNEDRFTSAGFKVVDHFGMERTVFQSNSVWAKLKSAPGYFQIIGQIGYMLSRGRLLHYPYTLLVRLIDVTIGRLFSISKSRIILTIGKKL